MGVGDTDQYVMSRAEYRQNGKLVDPVSESPIPPHPTELFRPFYIGGLRLCSVYYVIITIISSLSNERAAEMALPTSVEYCQAAPFKWIGVCYPNHNCYTTELPSCFIIRRSRLLAEAQTHKPLWTTVSDRVNTVAMPNKLCRPAPRVRPVPYCETALHLAAK